MSIKLGDVVRDKITGFTGIVVCRSEWLHGCVRIAVRPKALDKDGKPGAMEHFDEPEVERVDVYDPAEEQRASTGGPAREGPGFAR